MIGRQYAVTLSNATETTAKTQQQIKAGATTPLWINYVAMDGSSDIADGTDAILVRKTAGAATVTSFTPLLYLETAGTGQIAQAAGGATATGTDASAEGTDGDVLWRRQCSMQSGGGASEWFPEGMILVKATGLIGLKHNLAVTSTTITTQTIFSEIA